MSLLGRAEHCALLDRVIADIRRGESRSLVLRGEAGIGKSALLRYLVESGSDLTVARAVGVESEMELPFASLHQLCAPMLDRLEALPAPQRRARDAEIINRAAIARLYNRNPAEIIVVNHDTALAIKVGFPRPQSSGSQYDSDAYGGQQYAPLLELQVPD